MTTQPETARVERGPTTEVKRFALGMADLLERQGFTVAAAEMRRLHAECEHQMELNAALKEIYEIWAGSEGIPLPKTAPEAYLLGLVEQMRDIARDALASASTKPKYLSWQHAKWCASFGIPDDPNAKRPDCDCFMQRMEKIPVDRSVVQQALHVAMAAEHPTKLIAALRAALAEDALQKFTDVSQEIEAALAEPQEPDIAQQVVSEQAEDEGLWFVAVTASEAYLQQALRRLHAAVEGEDDQDAD